MIGPSTKVIDAHGAAVIPGLIDSHGHVRGLGEALEALDLRGIKSEAEIADRVRAAAKLAKPGEWILGAGMGSEPVGVEAVSGCGIDFGGGSR